MNKKNAGKDENPPRAARLKTQPKNPIIDPIKQKAFLVEEAKAQGFAVMGIVKPDNPAISAAGDRLRQALAEGRYADLVYMRENADRRADPLVLWPDARSIFMLGFNYGPDTDPREGLRHKCCGNISVYARNRDYHDIIKGKLKHIATRFAARTGEDVKVFVDTAPVMEKPLAQLAGLGFQGKHTNLVSREFGSWLFLASIFTTADLAADAPERNHCGSCRACLDACPTQAFPAPFKLDAERCISYLTIERKTQIPLELRQAMGNHIYGCDDCLAACPWNKFARVSHEAKLQARHDLINPPLLKFLSSEFDDAAFRAFFSGSPIKRIGYERFMRNVLIAAGNSHSVNRKGFVAKLKPYLSAESPLMRGAAIWALSRLMAWRSFLTLRDNLAAQEQDLEVRQEWDNICVPQASKQHM